MKKNKLVLYLFVIFTYSNTFSQDIAGSISINLLFKGDTVRFINKSESKKLRSINKKFILEDISVIKFGFKFPEHMKFPEKKIFQQNRNHILITNRETNDEMHIYIDNIPDRRYYINISFAKGNYFLTVLPTNKAPKDPGLLDETYEYIILKNEHLGYDITPVEWNKHKVDDNKSIENINLPDYLIRGKIEKEATVSLPFENKNVCYISDYYSTSHIGNCYKLIIKEGTVILVQHYYTPDESIYVENYGRIESIRFLHDSLIILDFDSAYMIQSYNTILTHSEFEEEFTAKSLTGLKRFSKWIDSAIIYSITEPIIPVGYVNFEKNTIEQDSLFMNYNFFELLDYKIDGYAINSQVHLNFINQITNQKVKLPNHDYYSLNKNNSPSSQGIVIKNNQLAIKVDSEINGIWYKKLKECSFLPLPVHWDTDNRYEHVERYIKLIKKDWPLSSIEHYKYQMNSNETKLFIPSDNWEEIFNITKALFFIPSNYVFPSEEKTVYSTPKNPSQQVSKGPYDFVNQFFIRKNDEIGSPSKIEYHNSNEIGSQLITITKEELGFRIEIVENGF